MDENDTSLEKNLEIETPEIQPSEPIPPQNDNPSTFTWRSFLGGFGGWYIINSLLWLIIKGDVGLICLGIGILLGNILALLVLAFSKSFSPNGKSIALGMLAAYALNFLISDFLGIFVNGTCGIPFFLGDPNLIF